jgi:hypothetical protein
MLTRSLVGLFLVASLVACGEDASSPTAAASGSSGSQGSGGAASSSATSAATGAGGSGTGGGDMAQTPTRATVTGDITWNVTFDDTAKQAGATDCSYTRHYVGVEDESRRWVCPTCDVVFHASVEMTAGKADCYTQVSMNAPLTDEWIGYGGGVFYRGYGKTTAQGTANVAGTMVTMANQVDAQPAVAGGTMAFAVAGTLTTATENGDPMNGFVPPKAYACGWPKADPPAYTGDYTIAKGKVVPDGLFKDVCDEVVRIHDFKGSYLVVDMSARDCGPCQQMAGAEEAFIAEMAGKGIEVHMISLLAPALANPFGETTKAMLTQWKNNFGLKSPVLGDRAWGLTMFEALFADQTGYPSWVVTDKDLVVLDYANGYDQFAAIKAAILANAGK